MAGYIFNLDSIESLMLYVNNGVYSTKINYPGNHWKGYQEATFADYATMKAGDNVYFFIDRKIYGKCNSGNKAIRQSKRKLLRIQSNS